LALGIQGRGKGRGGVPYECNDPRTGGRRLFLFGARELQRMEGGTSGPLYWPVAHFRVVRSTNPEIMIVDRDKHPGGTTGTDDV